MWLEFVGVSSKLASYIVGSNPIRLVSYYGSQHYLTKADVRTGTRKAEVALVGGYEVIKK